ncbi:hypothetical protein GCM10009809_40190 [Isoptericola hypogeus]|uniref:Uncharacterized protein n=1 Tax=Isoptericola hypogeus TaxID=300179 RepID=A0ABN2JVX0_9MICO
MDITSLAHHAELDRLRELDTASVFFKPWVSGIEVTQAIQFFDSELHLTDPGDRQGDNAQRIVANKPMWVRVYVRSLIGSQAIGNATLRLQRRVFGFLYQDVAILSAHSSSTPSTQPSLFTPYETVRGDIGRTVNFVVPASEVQGYLRLVVHLSAGSTTIERTLNVGATLRQTLRLAGVAISYNGPTSISNNANLQLAAPTVGDLQAMAGVALTIFPVRSAARFRIAGSLVQTNHLQDTSFPASGCGTQWNALHARVAGVRTADGNQAGWIYYGLLPAGTPMGPVGGCGGGGVAVGPIGQPWTLAHEAGHAAGLPHAPSGGAPNADPNFPAYEPYDPTGVAQGRTGEYGLDINNGQVKTPDVHRDVMGYAGPQWISPYNYGRLTDNQQFTPTTVGIDWPWWHDLVWEEVQLKEWWWLDLKKEVELPVFPPSRFERVISVIVQVDHGRLVDQVDVARTGMYTDLPVAGRTRFGVRLVDGEGRVIAEGQLGRLTTAASGCGCADDALVSDAADGGSYVAQVLLPDVEGGAALEIVDGDDVVWRREAPDESPTVDVARPRSAKNGSVTLRWESKGASDHWVRWSADGEEWRSVATGLVGGSFTVGPDVLPAGKVLLQVVAHDGFHSTASEPVTVTVPERAPQVAILHPQDGRTYTAGQELRLWGSAFGVAEDAADESAVWSIDGKEVARGLDAWVALDKGKHTVTLGISGAEASVAVTVEVYERPTDEDPTG